ncbi:hypothetical protein C8R46DRAFT_1238340 [Mycena filopes]|nr:hypothetical protein C8R46DRAFT_1238340 [Mycena filopes]
MSLATTTTPIRVQIEINNNYDPPQKRSSRLWRATRGTDHFALPIPMTLNSGFEDFQHSIENITDRLAKFTITPLDIPQPNGSKRIGTCGPVEVSFEWNNGKITEDTLTLKIGQRRLTLVQLPSSTLMLKKYHLLRADSVVQDAETTALVGLLEEKLIPDDTKHFLELQLELFEAAEGISTDWRDHGLLVTLWRGLQFDEVLSPA